MLTGADQSLGVLNQPMEVPQIDRIEPEPGEQDEGMVVSNQQSQELKESFVQVEHKEDLAQDVHPYLGKLGQEASLACPESIEEPGEQVDGLILYQTVEDETMENCLNTESLTGMTTRVLLETEGIPDNFKDSSQLGHADLADQVDEISEGQVGQVSLMDVPMIQPCDETTEEAVGQIDNKPNETELESIYAEYAHPSCTSTSITPFKVRSKPDETITGSHSGAGLKTELSVHQEMCEDVAENQNMVDGQHRAEEMSFHPDNKCSTRHHLGIPEDICDTKPGDIKVAPSRSANSIDSKTFDVKEQLELPVKIEETKMETADEALPINPDSSEVKPGTLSVNPIKSENWVTKVEQLDFSVKPEMLETKPEDLSLPMKPETLDTKPDFHQLAAYCNDTEIKPEAKLEDLGFAAYPDGASLKPETKPKGFKFIACPDSSDIKLETKPEGLQFTTYPDSSEMNPEAKPEGLGFTGLVEIKTETKQDTLEADSTVITPKLEQTDGLVETSENMVVKGQVKEERPNTPGKNTE